MKYYVITKWNNELLSCTTEEYNDITEALDALKSHQDLDSNLFQECYIEDEYGRDYDDILIEAKQRMMDNLISDDYDYVVWLNNNYDAISILSQIRRYGYEVVMEEICEDWADECQARIDEEEDEYILKEYAE